MKRNLPLILIAAVLLGSCVVAFFLYRSKQAALSAPFKATPSPVTTPSALPSAVAETTPSVPLASPTGVSVTVEEFGDYQCPPCGKLHPELKRIEAEYGARIEFVFRNLPLPTIHKNALVAARAAEAARLQGRFREMHDHLYDNQNAWKDEADPRPTFSKYAQDLGLDVPRFDRDMDGPEVQTRLAQDTQRADSMGVQGTPTILIEGRQLKAEVTTPEGIRKGINRMLAVKGGSH